MNINWKSIDLNLLITFQQMYQHRSVSIAAEKLYVSQSAMSHSLSRLRALFGDVLFERKGNVMQPTEHANELAPIINQILDTIQKQLLSREVFSPEKYQGVCRIGLTDYAEFIYGPSIYDAIRLQAPRSQVSFINVNRNNYTSVAEQDKLDVIVGSIPHPSEPFASQFLYKERHVCLYDPSIVEISKINSIEAFVQMPHALVSPDGSLQTQVDKQLGDLGLKRRVTVASRNFLTIRQLIKGRELVAIVPENMAIVAKEEAGLDFIQSPIAVSDFDISLLWYCRHNTQDKNAWLRSVVSDVILR